MTPTFSELKKAARKLPLNHPVWEILGAAEDNANDTVYLEHTVPESDWERIALDSIAVSFEKTTPKTTLRWFERRGYRW